MAEPAGKTGSDKHEQVQSVRQLHPQPAATAPKEALGKDLVAVFSVPRTRPRQQPVRVNSDPQL
jgi:hypothetical protein